MKKTLFIILLFSLRFTSSQNLPKPIKAETTWQTFKYDMGSIVKGMGHAYTRPAHWQGKQWLNFAEITAGTILLTFVDDEFDQWADGFRNDIPKGVLEFGNKHARPEGNYGLSGAVYFTGLFTKNEKLRRTGVLMISSTITAGILQQITTKIVGRARPLTGENSTTFDPFSSDDFGNYESFFSGHTALSFANAYAIAKQFKNPWVKGGIYTIGMIPGFSRIAINKHWVSDVVFGAVMSIVIVESIDKYLDYRYEQKYNNKDKKVNWDLNFSPGQIGLSLTF